jgi:hypothetical protein
LVPQFISQQTDPAEIKPLLQLEDAIGDPLGQSMISFSHRNR